MGQKINTSIQMQVSTWSMYDSNSDHEKMRQRALIFEKLVKPIGYNNVSRLPPNWN